VQITTVVDLPQTPKRNARTATLNIHAKEVAVLPPKDKSELPNIRLQVVLIREVDGPKDNTDVEWVLLTNMPIDSPDEINNIVSYYMARWGIEIYFRTLKSGCKVEDIQLETKARLLNALSLYSIIAWRIVNMVYQAREKPLESCSTTFSPIEIETVWAKVKKGKPFPTVPLTNDEMLRLIAQLGGYNNRKSDPPPGPKTIWRALRRLHDLLEGRKLSSSF
jgi:hypothetical protein